MRAALYARVSTDRQAQAQTIEQQLSRLRPYVLQHGWSLDDEHVFRDEGYSGASLNRPGLDALRDQARLAAFDVVVLTAPDRLARRYIHQVLLLEELQQHGCTVVFVERPMSSDPNDQLLLQIRGAVAEYERSLITERMRRGKIAKLRAGLLLPWTRRPFGYQLDPERPRDPAGVRLDPYEAAVVQQIYAWYLADGSSIYRVGKQLLEEHIPSPRGSPCWTNASIRNVLTNPMYTGTTYGNRYRSVAAQQRRSALKPAGPGKSYRLKPQSEWIAIAVPPIVSQADYERVQAKMAHNQQTARRNNTAHEYLLRGLINCGKCRLTATARTTPQGYQYYACRGRREAVRVAEGRACSARYIPAQQLDALVWQDVCHILTEPSRVREALQRAQAGQWLPQEMQARRATIEQGLASCARQQARLLDAYVGEVIELAEFERKRAELASRQTALEAQRRQLEAQAAQQQELAQVAASLEAACEALREGLEQATPEQQRALVELLIDCVVVSDADVEIRYVIPLSRAGPYGRFCHLRLDYRGGVHPQLRDATRGAFRYHPLYGALQSPAPSPSLGLSYARSRVLRCPFRRPRRVSAV
jgi:site-specific DNA recombinase